VRLRETEDLPRPTVACCVTERRAIAERRDSRVDRVVGVRRPARIQSHPPYSKPRKNGEFRESIECFKGLPSSSRRPTRGRRPQAHGPSAGLRCQRLISLGGIACARPKNRTPTSRPLSIQSSKRCLFCLGQGRNIGQHASHRVGGHTSQARRQFRSAAGAKACLNLM